MSFRNTNSSIHQQVQNTNSNSKYYGSSGRNSADSLSHQNNQNQQTSQNNIISQAKRDLLQRKAKEKNEEPEETPATPDSTTEPPKPVHDFQEGDDVFFHTDEGQNVLGTIGQVTPFRCQVLFGDGTQQWAPTRRLKKLSCSVDEPAPPPRPSPSTSSRRRSTSSNTSTTVRESSSTATPVPSPAPSSSPSPAPPVPVTRQHSNSSISITTDTRSHNRSSSKSVSPPQYDLPHSKDKIEIICTSCKSIKKLSPRKAALLSSQHPYKCTKCYVPGMGIGLISPGGPSQSQGQGPGPGQGQGFKASSVSRQLLRSTSSSGTSGSAASSSITNANQNTVSLSTFLKSAPLGGNSNNNSAVYHQSQSTMSTCSGIIGSPDLTVSRIAGPTTSPPVGGQGSMSGPVSGAGPGAMKPNRTSVSVPLTSPSPIKTGKTSNLCFRCGTRTCPYDRVHCNFCERYCHLMCLALSPQPLEGDKFWDVMCSACGTQTQTPNGEEAMSRVFSVRRSITSWSDVVHLIINCLKVKSLGQKYFDFDSQIIPFFDNNIDRLHLPRQYKNASIEDRKSNLLVALTSSRLRFANHKGSSSLSSSTPVASTSTPETKRSSLNTTTSSSGSCSSNSSGLSSGGTPLSGAGTLWSIRTDREKKGGDSLPTPVGGGRHGAGGNCSSGSSSLSVGRNLFSNSLSDQSFSQSDSSGSASFSSDMSASMPSTPRSTVPPFRLNQGQSPAAPTTTTSTTSSSSQPKSGNNNSNLTAIAVKKPPDLPLVSNTSSPRVLSKEVLLRNAPMNTNIILSPSKTPPIISVAKSQSGVRSSQPQRIARAATTTTATSTKKNSKSDKTRQIIEVPNSTTSTNSSSIHRQRLRVRLPVKPKAGDTSGSGTGTGATVAAAEAVSSSPLVASPNVKEALRTKHQTSLAVSPIPGPGTTTSTTGAGPGARGVSRKRVVSSGDEEDSLEDFSNKPSSSAPTTGLGVKSKKAATLGPQDKTQIEVSMGRAIKSARMELLPETSRIPGTNAPTSTPNPRGRPKLLRSSVKNRLNPTATTAIAKNKNNVKNMSNLKIGKRRGRPSLNPVANTSSVNTTPSAPVTAAPATSSTSTFISNSNNSNNNSFFNEDSLTNDFDTSNQINPTDPPPLPLAAMSSSSDTHNSHFGGLSSYKSDSALQSSLSRITSLQSILNKTGGPFINFNFDGGKNGVEGHRQGPGHGLPVTSLSVLPEVGGVQSGSGQNFSLESSAAPTDRLSMTIFKSNLINAAFFGGLRFQCLPSVGGPALDESQIARVFKCEDLKMWQNSLGNGSSGNSGENSSDSDSVSNSIGIASGSRRSDSNSNSNFSSSNNNIFSHWNPFTSNGSGSNNTNISNNNASGNRRPKRKSTLVNFISNSNLNSENTQNNTNQNAQSSTSLSLYAGVMGIENESAAAAAAAAAATLPKKRNRYQKTLDDHDAYEIVARRIDLDGVLRYQVVWREPLPEDSQQLDFDEEIENLFFRHEEAVKEKELLKKNSVVPEPKVEKKDLPIVDMKSGSGQGSSNNNNNNNNKNTTTNSVNNYKLNSSANTNNAAKDPAAAAAGVKLGLNGLAIKTEKDVVEAKSKLNHVNLNHRNIVSGKPGPKYVLGQGGIEKIKSPVPVPVSIPATAPGNLNPSGFTSSCGSVSVSRVPCYIDLTSDSP